MFYLDSKKIYKNTVDLLRKEYQGVFGITEDDTLVAVTHSKRRMVVELTTPTNVNVHARLTLIEGFPVIGEDRVIYVTK